MGWEVGGRQSLEGNPGAFFDRLKRLEDRNSDTGACSMHHSTERAALSRATHVPRVAPVTAQEAWSTHPASTPFGLRSHRTCGGRGGARARSTRAVAVTRIGRAQLAVKDGGATLPGHTSPVPSHEPILCGGASPQRGVRPPANTADIRAPAPPRKRRPRGSTQGDLGGGAGATTPTTGGGAASRLPRCPPGQRRRHRASARVQLVLRVAEARPRAGGTRARRAGGGRADTQPVPGRAPAGGRGTYAAVHIPSHLCPAPSRGSTGLAGVFTRPAGLPHPWGATSCTRKAAPRTDILRIVNSCPLHVAHGGGTPAFFPELGFTRRTLSENASNTAEQSAGFPNIHIRLGVLRSGLLRAFRPLNGFSWGGGCPCFWWATTERGRCALCAAAHRSAACAHRTRRPRAVRRIPIGSASRGSKLQPRRHSAVAGCSTGAAAPAHQAVRQVAADVRPHTPGAACEARCARTPPLLPLTTPTSLQAFHRGASPVTRVVMCSARRRCMRDVKKSTLARTSFGLPA